MQTKHKNLNQNKSDQDTLNQRELEQLKLKEARNKIIDEFVEDLPKMRKRIGLSQTELGERAGLSRQTISLIERKAVQLTWNNYLAMTLLFILNSGDIYYFPRKKGYKNYELLQEIMHVPDKTEGGKD